jgi:2-hydroxychromene-2-carboxylate isomerase
MPKAKDLSNQANLHFQTDAIINGGESMRGGKSLELQIAEAPERALWAKIMDWGKYKTSVVDQLVFTAEALDRIEARQHAQQSVLDQIAAAASNGVPVVIDYDEIEKRIAANMPTYVPQVKEGDN